jgi:hypothetical protein
MTPCKSQSTFTPFIPMERTILKGVHPLSENMFLKEESISLAHAYMMG